MDYHPLIKELHEKIEALERELAESKNPDNDIGNINSMISSIMRNLPGTGYRCKNDEAWTMEFISDQCEALTGYAPSDLIGNNTLSYAELIHPKYREYVRDTVQKAIEKNHPFFIEYPIITADSQQKWVWEQGRAIRFENEKTLILEGFIFDITYRKKIEQDLLESEERFKALYDNSLDSVYIMDFNGNFIDINPAAVRLTGFSKEEINKIDLNTLLDIAEIPEIINNIKNLKRTGVDDKLRQYKIKCKTGESRYIESCATVIYRQNKPVAILGIARDITDRKHIEQHLRVSNKKYRLLAEMARDMIITHDLEGKITYANPAGTRLSGYEPDNFLNHNLMDFLPAENLPDLIRRKEQRLSGNRETGLYEIEFINAAGEKIPLEVSSSLISDDENQDQILLIARDISERKKTDEKNRLLNERLMQAQKLEALGTLAGGVAHDFNNILASMIGYVELSMEYAVNYPKLGEYLSQVYKSGERAKNLVNQILSLSRRQQQTLVPVYFDLIVKDAVKLLQATLPSTIEIRQKINSKAPVMADPTQLYQIVMNLCTNAFQALENKGGTLAITLSETTLNEEITYVSGRLPPGRYAKLSVKDTGCGIPKNIINEIFDPYFTTKRPGEGTGLGLATVRGIITGYNGAINVFSEAGYGTLFEIFIPSLEKGKITHKKEDQNLPTGNETILLIDDEPNIVKIGNVNLRRLGYTVTTQTNSMDALLLFQSDPDKYDLVITDMTMPKLTGDRLSEEIFKIRPGIPIIICSGYQNLFSMERIAKLGVKAFLAKPIMKKELAETVRRVLDGENFLEAGIYKTGNAKSENEKQ